ncbi:hypothetical protein B0H17DRAFT_935258 [Mycena rosella]|uniref:Glycosyltransferase family 25 protein n=1 Tax=Mycena rosella TaxID=1033263 RepID=A0AAD7GJT7_MYCRO|nr:hypothetical protein B0H17DRAFT_935258 [Mycena rosella]
MFGATIALLALAHGGLSFPSAIFTTASRSPDRLGRHTHILPVTSRTYVISLPRRKDRYLEMERLRTRLGVQWSYISAEDSQSPLVGQIMSRVRSLRREALNATDRLPFEWPRTPVSIVPFEDSGPLPLPPPASDDVVPLTCATENITLVPYSVALPEYKILSPSRIACWHSHLSAIQRAASHIPEKPSLVVEDDVDMEVDIKERLLSVWSLLPPDWDVVFLGHCWSNESYYPALGPPPSPQARLILTHLYPSRAPLCTHAYALSAAGARRLLLHLTYPRFAYSRAIDHALAWLVQSGRLKSFSIVPSIVVQRKIGTSDVMQGKGSKWRDHLVHGVLDGTGLD